jgi:hypothetical protein
VRKKGGKGGGLVFGGGGEGEAGERGELYGIRPANHYVIKIREKSMLRKHMKGRRLTAAVDALPTWQEA